MNYTIALIFLLITTFGYSQQHKPDIDHDDHQNALFEIGVSTGAVYLVEEGKLTTGFHTHFTRQVSKTIPLLLGVGYEYIIDEHQHHSFGVVIGYQPLRDLMISASPGVRTSNGSLQFTSHFEATYGFDISHRLHLGPLLEYDYGKNDNHLTLGVHLGILVNRRHAHEHGEPNK